MSLTSAIKNHLAEHPNDKAMEHADALLERCLLLIDSINEVTQTPPSYDKDLRHLIDFAAATVIRTTPDKDDRLPALISAIADVSAGIIRGKIVKVITHA